MKLVRDVIREKALQELVTVEPAASIEEAAQLMTRWNVGALLVLERDRLVGIVSERDYVRHTASGRPVAGLKVEDLMTRAVRMVESDLTTDECMAVMTHLRIRHLPVMEGGQVLGVISIGDLVKDVVDEQAFVIEQLEAYITRAANA